MRSTYGHRKSKNGRRKSSGLSGGWRVETQAKLYSREPDREFSLRAARLLPATGLDSNETSYPPDLRGDAGVLGRGRAQLDAVPPAGHGAPEQPASCPRPRCRASDLAKQTKGSRRTTSSRLVDEARQEVDEANSTKCATMSWWRSTRLPWPMSGSADSQPAVVEREDAEGIPVPIVPGTRVTEAQPVPPVPPRKAVKARRAAAAAAARPEPKVVVKIASPEDFAQRFHRSPDLFQRALSGPMQPHASSSEKRSLRGSNPTCRALGRCRGESSTSSSFRAISKAWREKTIRT